MLALALALCSTLAPLQDPKPIPEDLAKEVRRAEILGQALFESDQAAWHGSDALAESKGPLEGLDLGGFLAVRQRDASWIVLFLSSEEQPRVLQRVQVGSLGAKPKLLDTPAPIPLSKEEAPLWAARQLAIDSAGPYQQPINPVVLRGSDFGEKGILVYLLAGSAKPDVAVLGRHVRVRVSDDGTRVEELLPLVKGVIESPLKTAEGKPVVGLMASQVVTDFPTEVQVFAQLNAGLPLYVATRRGVWKVDQGKVAYLGEKPPAKASLQIALRDRASADPRAGEVQLWRVGLPASPGWSAGDEYVGNFQVPLAGLAIPGLAPGDYRALSDAHAASAPDLAPFVVRESGTELALQVETPKTRTVLIDVVDAQGAAFERAEYLPLGRRAKQRLPAWLHPRSRLGPDGKSAESGPGGERVSTSRDGARTLVRSERGFELPPVREESSLYEETSEFELRLAGHGSLKGSVRCSGTEELRLRALLVEKQSLAGLFTLPGGGAVELEQLQVDTPLQPDTSPRPAHWWLDVPVRVSVVVPGCKRLDLEYRLREGRPPPRTLEKAP